jgi:hypothetical protein
MLLLPDRWIDTNGYEIHYIGTVGAGSEALSEGHRVVPPTALKNEEKPIATVVTAVVLLIFKFFSVF